MKFKLAVGAALLCGMSASANAATPAGLNLSGLLGPGANLLGIGESVLNPVLGSGSGVLGQLLSPLFDQSTGLFGVTQIFGVVGQVAPIANPVFTLVGKVAGVATLLPALPALPGLSQ